MLIFIDLFFFRLVNIINYRSVKSIQLINVKPKIDQNSSTLQRNQIHTSIEIKTGLVVDDLCHSHQVLCQQHTPLNIDLNKNSLLHRN